MIKNVCHGIVEREVNAVNICRGEQPTRPVFGFFMRGFEPLEYYATAQGFARCMLEMEEAEWLDGEKHSYAAHKEFVKHVGEMDEECLV